MTDDDITDLDPETTAALDDTRRYGFFFGPNGEIGWVGPPEVLGKGGVICATINGHSIEQTYTPEEGATGVIWLRVPQP